MTPRCAFAVKSSKTSVISRIPSLQPFYLVMELVTGGALNDFLKKKAKTMTNSRRTQVLGSMFSLHEGNLFLRAFIVN